MQKESVCIPGHWVFGVNKGIKIFAGVGIVRIFALRNQKGSGLFIEVLLEGERQQGV